VPGMSEPSAVPPIQTARPPSYGRVSLGIVMSAREANLLGNIHGGEIVKLADSTAGAGGARFSGVPAKARAQRASFVGWVASAYFVFVAIDAEGNARPVPALAPETDHEVRRMREVEIRRAHRLARKQEIEAGRKHA